MKAIFSAMFMTLLLTSISLSYASGAYSPTQSSKSSSLCFNESDADARCQAFISGFLQGALLTGGAIVTSFYDSSDSSFSERALRTRLNSRNDPVTQRAGFCLPEGHTTKLVVSNVLAQLKKALVRPENETKIGQHVYGILKQNYPC